MVTVVHCKRDPYDVYIGRPSKWGNPFTHLGNNLADFKVNNREEAVAKYREWIVQQPELMSRLQELEGKTLGCFCAPLACHGDVLKELLEEQRSRTAAISVNAALVRRELEAVLRNDIEIYAAEVARKLDELGHYAIRRCRIFEPDADWNDFVPGSLVQPFVDMLISQK